MVNWATLLALAISGMALAISAITAWLTFFRRGTLRMTRPTTIYFGPDGEPHTDKNKIYMRSLLYSTSKSGQLIENMYARLSKGEVVRNFYIWVHGQDRPLSRGSGLFVGQDGVVANHHFLPSPDETDFHFKAGTYRLDVFANVILHGNGIKLYSSNLEISPDDERAMRDLKVGLYFDWGPDSQKYYSHLDTKNQNLTRVGRIEIGGRHESEKASKVNP